MSYYLYFLFSISGCKIKALRAKTNTYIKTPVRGEEPVFVVTGRKEDVGLAKREILSAAEHFSQIRASRRNNGTTGPIPPGPPSPNAPGQVTIQVRVPYRVVGLVVGPKGATIKRIQQQTHTYIVTPSRDREPVFEVTGAAESVEKARQEIEGHIAMRTGGMLDSPPGTGPSDAELQFHNHLNDFHTNGVDSGFQDLPVDLLGSLYKPPSNNSAFSAYRGPCPNRGDPTVFTFPPTKDLAFSTGGLAGLYEGEEVLGSPGYEPNSVWADHAAFTPIAGLFGLPQGPTPHRSGSLSTPRLSPTLTESNGSSSPGAGSGGSEHGPLQRMRSDPLTGGLAGALSSFAPLQPGPGSPEHFPSTSSGGSSQSASPTESGSPGARRHCLVCTESEVVAALVPCGHNLFCMECAALIVEKPETERRCPVCQQAPSQAIRIFS